MSQDLCETDLLQNYCTWCKYRPRLTFGNKFAALSLSSFYQPHYQAPGHRGYSQGKFGYLKLLVTLWLFSGYSLVILWLLSDYSPITLRLFLGFSCVTHELLLDYSHVTLGLLLGYSKVTLGYRYQLSSSYSVGLFSGYPRVALALH
jgi:hypothetical protein